MRKFTLLFMSMFLVLGTAMAKDEESKEDKGFTLVSADPNSNTPVQIVDIIRLTFSKDITVTLPEGGIEVTNENTKESIKIASILEKNNIPLEKSEFGENPISEWWQNEHFKNGEEITAFFAVDTAFP